MRMPHIHAEAVSREEIRAGIERLQGLLEYFVQNTHPGVTQVDGDTASGRAGNVITLGGRPVLPGLRVHSVVAAMPRAVGGDRLAMC